LWTYEETATPPQKRPYPAIDPKRTPATSPLCDGYPSEDVCFNLGMLLIFLHPALGPESP